MTNRAFCYLQQLPYHVVWLMIIITQMRMTNRLEEPESWAVIDTFDSEQEIQHDQQSFLLLAAFALSCLESY